MKRWLWMAAAILLLGGWANAQTQVPDPSTTNRLDWTEVTAEQMDTRILPPAGHKILAMEGISWKHAQTEHFVLHYEASIFAVKVARLAESFYTYISKDLGDVADRVGARSHIFIFKSDKRWQQLLETMPGVEKWSFSFVSGLMMCLQQSKGTLSSSASILGHEMTHLVVNRFLPGRLPLWLNEGLAEYYGEFAYAAHKGIKKSKRAQFTRLGTIFPLEHLLDAKGYPVNTRDVQVFYQTSKYLVGFLLLAQPTEPFIGDVLLFL